MKDKFFSAWNDLSNRSKSLLILVGFVGMVSIYVLLLQKYILVKDEPIENMHYNGYFPHPVVMAKTDIPKRVIVMRPEIADTLITLGVGESVKFLYVPPERRKDIPHFKQMLPNAIIRTKDLTREEAILLQPDYILGWHGSFDPKKMGSAPYWNKRGVPTYMEENSGAMPDPYPPFKKVKYPPFCVDNEIQFIANMGKIFHKEAEAEREIKKIREALAEVVAKAKAKGPRTVMTMQFRRGQVEVLGDKTLSGDIIMKMGCKNMDYEGLLMPVENFLMMDPDCIIVIYDYIGGAYSLKNQVEMLRTYPFSQLRAVRENRLGGMQYFHELITTNVHTADSIRKIYKEIYEPVAQP